MRLFLVLLLLFATAASAAETPVFLQVREQRSWCGGIAPPPDFSYDQPFSGTLEISPGRVLTKAAPAVTLTIGKDGRASAALAPGTWCVAEAGRRAKVGSKAPRDALPGCWPKYTTRCDAVLTVKAGKPLHATVELSRPCPWASPCMPPRPGPP